jgi:hypothetical protein
MASMVPPLPDYGYNVVRLKMAGTINSIVSNSLCCHYGEIGDVFLIGGVVQPFETLMASAIAIVVIWSISVFQRITVYVW